MSFVSLYLVAGVVLAGIVGAQLARLLPPRAAAPVGALPQDPRRHAALQGLRGLLAFGVFMHHSFIWSRYARGHGWVDAALFHQFGESRVVLFYMLTATLFYGRLLDARGRTLDWLKLYVSRLLRLGPAYWFAMLLMFAAIAYATVNHIDGAGMSGLTYSWREILGQCGAWMGFSMLGMPSIDGYFSTPVVVAAVTWTLPYECVFYLLLPLLALPLRVKMPATALGIGLAAAVWLAAWAPEPALCAPFAGGFVVAQVMRVPRLVALLRKRACALAAMVAMTAAILAFPTMYAPLPMLLLLFSMAVVACDNTLFGILDWRLPQALGRWAYSLYMLHGVALYTLFMLVLGAERSARLSDWQYAGVIAACVPVVLALSWASQRWIESPPMRAVPAVVAVLRGAVARLRRPVPTPAAVVPLGAGAVVPLAAGAVLPAERRAA